MAKKATTSISLGTCENPSCKNTFRFRKGKRSCSEKCRKVLSRKSTPAAQGQSESEPFVIKIKNKDSSAAYELAMDLASQYYSTEQGEREIFLRSIIEVGASNEDGIRYRRAMTCPNLLKVARKNRSVFFRRCPESYLTLAQIADKYCGKVVGIPIQEYMKNPRNFERFPLVHDMRPFDVPRFSKKKPAAMTEEQIREKMATPLKYATRPRSPELTNYYVRLFAYRTDDVEQTAA